MKKKAYVLTIVFYQVKNNNTKKLFDLQAGNILWKDSFL